jgi:8-oxo-dGTP diphosphatase
MQAVEPTDVIRAAGALLWQGPPERRVIAVVHRNRYDDWTLPKGKLKKDESWEQAALREVKEETGYDARILGFAGSVSYEVNGRPKIVRYWHMVAEGEPSELDDEVDELVWLPIEQAIKRLQYPLEKSLLEQQLHPNASDPPLFHQ